MKATALTMTAIILATIAAPSASHAGQQILEMNITVMSRGEVDLTKLKTETYAYMAYRTDGIERAAWGRIVQIEADGIVIESDFTPSETRKIAFGNIDTLAVAEDRLAFESWLNARLAAEKITVMTREDLDLTKLATGSYAHVVYTWKGFKRTTSGEVVELGPYGIVVESGAEQLDSVKIGAVEIDTLAFARTVQAVNRWKKWTESGIVHMSRWDLNPSMLDEGLYVHVVYVSGSAKRKVAGRIVDRYTDRILIQYWIGGKTSFARREKLEIAFGDIETVLVSRDQQDLQMLETGRTSFGHATERKVHARPRVALKLVFGTVFGTLTAGPVILSHYPGLFMDTSGPSIMVIPTAVLHAAATAYVVNKVDPTARYRPTFAGSLLGCSAVASAILLSDLILDEYQSFDVAVLEYPLATACAATIASEISRGPPDARGFSVGLAPRKNGSVSAVATYRF